MGAGVVWALRAGHNIVTRRSIAARAPPEPFAFVFSSSSPFGLSERQHPRLSVGAAEEPLGLGVVDVVSVAGSQRIFRPSSMAMTPKWPTLAERWATSAGVMVAVRVLTQSRKFW